MLTMYPELSLLFGLAICVKYVTDTIGRPLVDYYKLPHSLLRVVALGFGLALAFGVRVPLVDNGLEPWAAMLVTGVLIGGGGGLIHDFIAAIDGSRKQRRPPTL